MQFTPVLYTVSATAYSSTEIYNYFLILGFYPQPPPGLPRHVMEQCTSWKANGSWRTFQHFTESDASLPCSQKPSTSANPEPNHLVHSPSILLLEDSLHYCTPIYAIVFEVSTLTQRKKCIICLQFSFSNRVGDNAGNMPQQSKIRTLRGAISNVTLHFSQHAPRSNLFALPYLASALQRFLPAVKRLLIWSCTSECSTAHWRFHSFSSLSAGKCSNIASVQSVHNASEGHIFTTCCLSVKHKSALVCYYRNF